LIDPGHDHNVFGQLETKMKSAAVQGTQNHVPTIFLCILAALCEGIELQVAGVAAPGIAAELKPGPTLLGYFFSAGTFGLLIGALVGGYLADRIGRKRVLVCSVAAFGIFSLVTMLAWDAHSLILARLLTGLGLGGGYPNLIALTSEASAGNRRNANVTLVYAVLPLGGALVSLGSYFTSPEHWRWLFAFGGLMPLIIVPIMARYLRESPAFTAQQALAGNTRATASASFGALLSAGRAGRTLLLWLSFVLALIIQYALLSWLPTLMISSGLGKPQAAFAQIGFNVGGALAALLIGPLLEGRWRRMAVIVVGLGLPLLMAVLAYAPAQVLIMAALATGIGAASLSTLAFLYATAPIFYPTAIRGTGVGAAVGAGRLGSVIGPLIGGALMAIGHSPGRLLIDLVPIAMGAAICAIMLVSTKLPDAAPESLQARPT
jgi:AAHS family 3-hydroxyphenylpropionic acid transporter